VRALARATTRRLRAEQGGFTLVELLVAAVLGLALIGAATTVFTTAIQSQPRTSSRNTDIAQARTTMERITRELRQGWNVPSAGPAQLSILTYVKSATCGGAPSSSSRACRVTYTCTTTSCSRVEANPDGTGAGPSQIVVSGFSGPNAFTYSPSATDPSYVGVELVYPADGGDAITLEDGVALRNPGAPL
jgi:prepilin-type N-terminal cleavage/methylation domain-containing protein